MYEEFLFCQKLREIKVKLLQRKKQHRLRKSFQFNVLKTKRIQKNHAYGFKKIEILFIKHLTL